jgi:hypothetical protein
MIHSGDRVQWDAQGTIPAGTGIVLAVAQGCIPTAAGMVEGNRRSYIVRSDEWQSDEFHRAFENVAVAAADSAPYAQLITRCEDLNQQADRKLLWLVDIRPEALRD